MTRRASKSNSLSVQLARSVSRRTLLPIIATLGVLASCNPGLDSKDPTVRARAVEKVKDDGILAKVAISDRDADVRVAAIRRLADQALLAKLAAEATDGYIGVNAVMGLRNQVGLANIALHGNDQNTRCEAIKKLTDQIALAKIAAEAEGNGWYAVRQAALGKVTDQTVLAKAAFNDKEDAWIRCVAVRNLTDQELLTKLALGDKNIEIRRAAVNDRLTDQALLAKIAIAEIADGTSDSFDWINERLTGEDGEERLDMGSPRRKAVQRVTNQSLLVKLAIEAEDQVVRSTAYLKIDSANASTEMPGATGNSFLRPYETALLQIPSACESIPEKHRDRLRGAMLGMPRPVLDALVVSELGEVKEIKTTWEPRRVQYTGPSIEGEEFTVAIKLSKTDRVVFQRWTTEFPRSAPYHEVWKPAMISPADVARAVCRLLPKATLTKISTGSKDGVLRCAAASQLADEVPAAPGQ